MISEREILNIFLSCFILKKASWFLFTIVHKNIFFNAPRTCAFLFNTLSRFYLLCDYEARIFLRHTTRRG